MQFAILGPLEVHSAGVPVRVGGGVPRRLLAVLLLHPNRSVGSDRLIDLLWGDEAPETAANTLQVHVAGLRRVLAGAEPASNAARIETTTEGYRIRVERGELDAEAFEEALATARRFAGVEPARALEAARAGLARWRGEVLADVPLPAELSAEPARLDALRRSARELVLGIEIRSGEAAAAVPTLEALVADDPTDERWLALLMLALYRANRQADALAALRDGRRRLADELGLDPGPELQRLELAILRQDVDLEGEALLAGGVAGMHAFAEPADESPLPAEVNAFVGRDAELEALEATIEGGARLVTVTGIGGTGKSRLALRLARRLAERFDGNVRWADLAPLPSADLVADAIASALGVRQQLGRAVVDSIVGQVGERRLLLVVDNCEPVLWHVAHLLERLVRACPGLVVVATSREPLGLAIETVRPLHGFEPAAGLSLFVARGAAANPDREIGADELEQVAAIVRRLDGLPLAIEMAAAWLRVMGPAEIAARLSDRDRLLGLSGATTDTRQQTLRATFDSSFELLAPREQRLLARLSAFAGPVPIDAIERVCGDDPGNGGTAGPADIATSLARLVERSLVVPVPSGTATRYRLLDTIREYGRLRLHEAGDDIERTRRHLAWVLDVAERAYRRRIADESNSIRTVSDTLDEIRLALDRATTIDPEARPHLASFIGWFWPSSGRIADGKAISEAALEEAVDPADRARLLRALGGAATYSQQPDRAIRLIEESLAIWRELGDEPEVCLTHDTLGWAHVFPGDNATALQLFRDGAALAGRIGDRDLRCILLSGECQVLVALGRMAEARAKADVLLEEAAVGDHRTRHFAYHFLGDMALVAGDGPTAAAEYGQALTLAVALDDAVEIVVELQGVAMAQAALGRAADAVRLTDAGDAWCRRLGVSITVPFWLELQARWIAPARASMTTAAAASGAPADRATEPLLSPAEAVELARRLPTTA